jgi:hypothetical protein
MVREIARIVRCEELVLPLKTERQDAAKSTENRKSATLLLRRLLEGYLCQVISKESFPHELP